MNPALDGCSVNLPTGGDSNPKGKPWTVPHNGRLTFQYKHMLRFPTRTALMREVGFAR